MNKFKYLKPKLQYDNAHSYERPELKFKVPQHPTEEPNFTVESDNDIDYLDEAAKYWFTYMIGFKENNEYIYLAECSVTGALMGFDENLKDDCWIYLPKNVQAAWDQFKTDREFQEQVLGGASLHKDIKAKVFRKPKPVPLHKPYKKLLQELKDIQDVEQKVTQKKIIKSKTKNTCSKTGKKT